LPDASAVMLPVPSAASCVADSAANCPVVSKLTFVVVNVAIVLVGKPAIWEGVRLVKEAIGTES
jgi:hypothetical protein